MNQAIMQTIKMIDTAGGGNAHWYVLRAKSRQEERAYANLVAWGVECYLPLIREHKAGLGIVVHALFPNYLFARFNAAQMLHKIRLARGVHYVVSFDGRPARIDDSVINALRTKEETTVWVGAMKPGDRIRVLSGPFRHLEGAFSEACDERRVMILLDALNEAALVVDRELIGRVT